MNNISLSFGRLITRVCVFAFYFFIIVFLIMPALFYFNPLWIDSLGFTVDAEGFQFSAASDSSAMKLSTFPLAMFLFMWAKMLAQSILLLFIFKNFLNVVDSVKAYDSFKKQNVRAFERIAFCFLIFWIISIFSVLPSNGAATVVSMRLTFTSLYLSAIAFIMAGIFKEGNKLQEENKLTV